MSGRRGTTRRAAAALAALATVAAGACRYEEAPEEEGEDGTTTTVLPSTTVEESTTTTEPLPDLGAVAVALEEVAVVDQPTAIAARPGEDAVYVAERPGRVRRIDVDTDIRRERSSGPPTTTKRFELARTPVLDLTDEVLDDGQEQGLLGLTFSPDGRRMYLAFTGTDGHQHLHEVEMDGDGPEPRTRREILAVPDFAPNHNGGGLAFGPDGFLYWGMGDGGGADDPRDTGQDPGDLLGAILRIDVDVAPEDRDAGRTYAVPSGNPFVLGGGAPEVWAFGLRNPWRFSFDRETGDLWIADVGQGAIEEIDLLPAGEGAGRGANLGWPLFEGDRRHRDGEVPDHLVAPLHTYDHGGGRCSVTGGFVYRGRQVPALVGAYLYGDHCEGEVRALVQRDGQVLDDRPLGLHVPLLSSFGEDAEGELWVLSLEGPVYRIVAAR